MTMQSPEARDHAPERPRLATARGWEFLPPGKIDPASQPGWPCGRGPWREEARPGRHRPRGKARLKWTASLVGDFLTALGRPVEFRRETMTTPAAELGGSRPAELLTSEFRDALLRAIDGGATSRR